MVARRPRVDGQGEGATHLRRWPSPWPSRNLPSRLAGLLEAEMPRKERQHLFFEPLRDAVAVVAFVGFVGMRDAEALQPVDEHLVARDEPVLQADVERERLVLLQIRHVL